MPKQRDNDDNDDDNQGGVVHDGVVTVSPLRCGQLDPSKFRTQTTESEEAPYDARE